MSRDSTRAGVVQQVAVLEALPSSTRHRVLVARGEAKGAVAGSTTAVVVAVEVSSHQPGIVGVVATRAGVATVAAQRLIVDGAVAVGATGEGLGEAIRCHSARRHRRGRSNLALPIAGPRAGDLTVVVAGVGVAMGEVGADLLASSGLVVVELRVVGGAATVLDLEVQVAECDRSCATEGTDGLTTLDPLPRHYEDLV